MLCSILFRFYLWRPVDSSTLPDHTPALWPQSIYSGRYVAEIFFGSNGEQFWYYIVQRVGSSKVIDLSKCQSHAEALKQVQGILDRLNS